MAVRFFKCNHCGQIVGLIVDEGVPLICCGEAMEELVPNTVDAAAEKHVPVVSVDGDTIDVKIGSVEHPMADEHYIEWIYIRTGNGGQRRALKPGDEPHAVFRLADGEAVEAAYAMCNLHGLWMAEV